jgi:hypothetical protein
LIETNMPTPIYLATYQGPVLPEATTLDNAAQLEWWKSLDGLTWRGYATGTQPLGVVSEEITLWSSLQGESHHLVGGFHYVVETDVPDDSVDDFNAWYDTEHLPGLARVPGTISAKRYLRTSGSPRYIACYELVSPEVMVSEAWLAIRNTSWSDRVRPLFVNTTRVLYVRPNHAAP